MELEKLRVIDGEELKQLTPELLAELFAHMDNDQQAMFFNHVDKVASTWSWPIQLQYVTDSEELTLAGRRVMQSIGEYSHWGITPKA